MKKTLTINLAGLVYNIDEDAYEKLKKYLERVEKQFTNGSDRQEIMKDIEARIAELLNEKVSGNRQVVSIAHIEEIISILGEADDFNDEGAPEPTSTYQHKRSYRRMYRDPDNRIIGGVCSGLGAYWHVDPSIMRIVFIVLTIFGLAGIIIYLILWIVLPEANTVSQKLEMRGEPVNINNIKDFMKDEFQNVKDSMNFSKTK